MASLSKTVLITGGNRGLGLSLVETFAKKTGWNVIATARNIETLPKEVDGARIQRYQLDLVSHNSVVDLADKLLSSHQGTPTAKKIDVVIHNAGFNPKDQKHREAGYFESTSYISQFSASNVGESILINSLHPMELTGRLFPMLANDAVVIAISSWLGSISTKTIPGHYGYAGSKALMNMLIKGMSVEFSKDSSTRRTAVALNPGWMKTDMGGPNADTTPVDVAARIFSMIDDVDSDDDSGVAFIKQCNGKFINTDRTEHEW